MSADRPHTILVWQVGALGDTLLTFPALYALRSWAPRATIHAVGRSSYLFPAVDLGLLSTVLDSDSSQGTALGSGQGTGEVAAPDLAVIWSSGAQRIADGLTASGAGALLLAPAQPATLRHQARYLLDCLRPLGVSQVLRPVPPPERIATDGDSPLVVVHPGAGSRWKRWPLQNYLELAVRLRQTGLHVRWSLGPADEDIREHLSRTDTRIGDELWPEMSVPAFTAQLARCDLLVSGDCGVAHLGALLGVSQVTLFGPTDPRRWRPLSRNARVLQADAPCGGDWRLEGEPGKERFALQRCLPMDRTTCRCLATLSVESVLSACMSILRTPAHRMGSL